MIILILIRELRALRETNNHGEAYQLAAHWLGFDDLAETFRTINQCHYKLGYLSHDLSHLRHAAYEEMITRARKVLSQSNFEKFHASF